jgi:hypothetical protein
VNFNNIVVNDDVVSLIPEKWEDEFTLIDEYLTELNKRLAPVFGAKSKATIQLMNPIEPYALLYVGLESLNQNLSLALNLEMDETRVVKLGFWKKHFEQIIQAVVLQRFKI